jgi:senataxin
MHPEISLLPSRVFYQGKLLDGPDMDVKTGQPWHLQEKFGPYKFFNVAGQEETGRSHSLVNRSECQMAVALYARLCQEFPKLDLDFRVGVISMYRAQIGELKRAFVQRFGQDIIGKILFHTVDGFQGQEKDVIILSCVRAGPGLQNIGFLAGKDGDYDCVSAHS